MQDIPQNIPCPYDPFIISNWRARATSLMTTTGCKLKSNSMRSQHRKFKKKKNTARALYHYTLTIFHTVWSEILLEIIAPTFVIQILLSLPTVFSNQLPHTEPKHRSLPGSSRERKMNPAPEGSSRELSYLAAYIELQACQYQKLIDSTGPSVPLDFVFQ